MTTIFTFNELIDHMLKIPKLYQFGFFWRTFMVIHSIENKIYFCYI